MSKPRGMVEPSMVAVSVNEYVGDVSRAGYYEGHGVAHFLSLIHISEPTRPY